MLSRESKEFLFSQYALELQGWTSSALPTLDATAVAQLLAELPSIKVKSERTFVSACKRWLRVRQCISFYEQVGEELSDFVINNLPLDNVDAAIENVTQNFHMFKGKNKGQFILWVYRRLKRLPQFQEDRNVVHSFDLDLSDFCDDRDYLDRFKDFEYVKNGSTYLVRIGVDEQGCAIVWKVPSLKMAKRFWPITAQKVRGKYIAVKVVGGKPIPAHRLLFDISPDEQVKAWNGDLLDWTSAKYIVRIDRFNIIEAEGWTSNLYLSNGTSVNGAAARRQKKFESAMAQFGTVENEDGTVGTQDFGGWGTGYATPVQSSDLYRETQSGKNTAANADLGKRTGRYGRIADCGRSLGYGLDPAEYGQQGIGRKRDGNTAVKGRVDDVAELRSAWGLD